MSSRFAADAILVLHLLFIVFVMAGSLLACWRLRYAGLHLPALAWGLWIEISGSICPLTPLEIRLRISAGESGYSDSFIEHYLMPLIYPPGLQAENQWAMATILVATNLLLYGWALRRHFLRRAHEQDL